MIGESFLPASQKNIDIADKMVINYVCVQTYFRRRYIMALIDSEESAKRFKEKLDSGFYKRDRSQNTEVTYAQEKLERDTKAVEKFTKSELFQELAKECLG